MQFSKNARLVGRLGSGSRLVDNRADVERAERVNAVFTHTTYTLGSSALPQSPVFGDISGVLQQHPNSLQAVFYCSLPISSWPSRFPSEVLWDPLKSLLYNAGFIQRIVTTTLSIFVVRQSLFFCSLVCIVTSSFIIVSFHGIIRILCCY